MLIASWTNLKILADNINQIKPTEKLKVTLFNIHKKVALIEKAWSIERRL